MVKNLISWPILGRLAQIWVPKIFFVGFTSTGIHIVPSYHPMQFQENLEKKN